MKCEQLAHIHASAANNGIVSCLTTCADLSFHQKMNALSNLLRLLLYKSMKTVTPHIHHKLS
ncbi:hypothetical protein QSI_1071 [Clostridioides difficile P28]|nr:hypothetical protein QSI_1071 [Clostridioides difficile P28]